ncbi:MAG: hypothetical protein IKG03_08110 [Clostridiales bacterium]|nr:hypothetical protein [Clostridiales bacterium]
MITNSIKKTVSVLLTGAVLFSLAGCMNLGGGSKKAVIEAAETFAADMAAADASKLIKNSTLSKKSDEASALTELLSDSGHTDDEIAFYKAVEKTIDYEIDEDSVSVDKDSASVNIIFSIADYSDVLLEDFKNADELTSAIKKADSATFKFTAEFSKEDKEWIPDNVGSKKFMKFYEYRKADISFALTAEMIAGFIDKDESSFWIYGDENKYTDTTFIEYDYYFDSAILGYEDRGEQIYFVLKKDGAQIYCSSDMRLGENAKVECRVEGGDIGLEAFGEFESGTYTIELYYKGENGDELVDSNSIDVEKTVVPILTTGTDPSGDTLSGEGDYYAFTDFVFRSFIIDAEWYDYDDCMIDDMTYTTDVQTIAFSMQVKPAYDKAVDYQFYYSENADTAALEEALTNPIYSATISPKQYSNGYFYDIEYDVGGSAKPGLYVFAVFEAGTENILMYGFCAVS